MTAGTYKLNSSRAYPYISACFAKYGNLTRDTQGVVRYAGQAGAQGSQLDNGYANNMHFQGVRFGFSVKAANDPVTLTKDYVSHLFLVKLSTGSVETPPWSRTLGIEVEDSEFAPIPSGSNQVVLTSEQQIMLYTEPISWADWNSLPTGTHSVEICPHPQSLSGVELQISTPYLHMLLNGDA